MKLNSDYIMIFRRGLVTVDRNNLTHNGFAAIANVLSASIFQPLKYLALTTLISTLLCFLFQQMIPKSFRQVQLTCPGVAASRTSHDEDFKAFMPVFYGYFDHCIQAFPGSGEPKSTKKNLFRLSKAWAKKVFSAKKTIS